MIGYVMCGIYAKNGINAEIVINDNYDIIKASRELGTREFNIQRPLGLWILVALGLKFYYLF
jgi:hypothetical protein